MEQIVHAINWKAEETTGKRSTDQGEMPWFAEVKGPQPADMDFIERTSDVGALRYAVQRSGRDDYEIADEIHISHGHMSKVLKGSAVLGGAKLVKFMRVTESLAPLQWLADQMGCDLVRRAPLESEVERLRREVAELRGHQRRA